MKPIRVAIISAFTLLPAAFAQTAVEEQKTFVNRDVVMLAKAGFSADFIIDTIQSGKSQFDTRAKGLAELAKDGLNERVLRVIAGVKTPSETVARPEALPTPSAELYIPGTGRKTRTQVIKPSPVGLAIATQTAYYESTSFLFGLIHKNVGVGAVPRGDQVVAPQMGSASNSSRMMANFPAVVSPAGSATRYVIIP
jgi:hypothetical protein